MQQTTPQPPAPQAAKPKPPQPPAEFQEGAIATMDAAGLIKILGNPASTEFQRSRACMRLGELAPKEAVPALAALLTDEKLHCYARYGLEPIADASASDALRASMAKLKGNLLIGVVNSLAKRRDEKAGPALAKMIYGADAELARAAAAAVGSIGSAQSAKELAAAMGKTTGLTKMAVADATLVCAERMLADGKRDQAMAVYASMTGTDVPKAARLAAMGAIIREETAVTRPK